VQSSKFGLLLLNPSQLWTYYAYGNGGLPVQLGLMFVLGMMSNGPYSLITTAVSADLVSTEIMFELRPREGVASQISAFDSLALPSL